MALKALLLRKKIDGLNKQLELINSRAEELRQKTEALNKREAELEAAVNEMTDETTEEERSAVNELVEQFEADREAHNADISANEDERKQIDDEIAATEEELKEIEAKQTERPAASPEPEPVNETATEEGDVRMNRFDLNSIITRENVKAYLDEVRACIREKRALNNVGLTTPEEFMGFIRENIEKYSKLYKHVWVRKLGGDGRVVVMGGIPEAVWTDCCANINELDLNFNDDEFGCWKVGGFFSVCNATLEDSDLALASELVSTLGQAIGLALDKAVVYGTGNRMPLGIIPRLLQTSKPATYSATAREWVDLHTSNVKAINSSGMTAEQLFATIVEDSGAAKGKYSNGTKVWVMNETTHMKLTAAAISLNAAGAIVSGVGNTMPIVGGVIEELEFMPDNIMLMGYFDEYTLAERAGQKFATSEHVRFLQDQTVFKATARYDGHPVIAEGFVAMSLLNTSISGDAVSFAQDEANTANGIVLNKSSVSVAETRKVQLKASTIPANQPVTWTSADTSKATVSSSGEVTGVAATTGVTITAASGNANAFCTVVVTA